MASQVFVGRQRELVVLAELAARARADQPQVVLVEGDAGMGKSTLLAKFAPAVSGTAVLRASGDEGESTLSYGVIGQVAAAARSLGVATPALLSGELAESLDPLAVGAELLSVFDTLGRPGQLTLLLVDDLHWSDPLSARSLLFCLRRLLADRVLVVVTARPGQLARHGEGWYRFFAGDERATRLRLDPLGTAEVVALSRELGTGQLSGRAAAALLEHTAGNPLYCVALLQELGAEQLDRVHGPPRVPRDLASVLLARVSRLQPAAQDLVMAAAVLGQRSPLRLAGAASHIKAANAMAALGGAWAATVTAEAALALARGAPGDALHAVAQLRGERKGEYFGIAGLLDWRSLEVEALVTLAQPELAAQRLGELEQLQGDGASPLASACTARLRALLSMARGDRTAASRAFADAWQHASGLRVPLVLAQLEMDEARFLRQSGRRKRALARLRSASARLAALGARPYAQLCDQELARCQARPEPGQTRRELGLSTAEFAVARAVGRGLTNKEAAEELYLSVKTIEFHLSHIFMKLDIGSRRELARLLEDPEQGSLSAADEAAPR